MTEKDQFIAYVKGVIDSEIETAKMELLRVGISNANYKLTGPLKLIKDALDKLPNEGDNSTDTTIIPDTN